MENTNANNKNRKDEIDIPNPEDLTLDNILSFHDPISYAIENFISNVKHNA